MGHTDEEAGFDDAGHDAEGEFEFFGLGEGGEGELAVEVGVAVVGEEGGAIGVAALGDGGAEGLELADDGRAGEFDDLDEDGEVGAEVIDDFFLADDDDEFVGDAGDDFFAGEVAAAAFGEVEVGIDFVGAVRRRGRGFRLAREWRGGRRAGGRPAR